MAGKQDLNLKNRLHGTTTGPPFPCEFADPGWDLYAVPVSGAYLLYSPLRQVSALVNPKALFQLKKKMEGNASDHETGQVEALFHMLAGSQIRLPDQNDGVLKPEFLGIIPTRACNLACAYCGFGSADSPEEVMDLKMAAAAVDWMADQVKKAGRDRLDVHFFGGEPFVAPEVVEVSVHRARLTADKLGLTPYFEVATNGVFDENQARFVGDYFDTVVLSFDGPEEIHDRHRSGKNGKGSFPEVFQTAKRLSQSPAKLCFRACISLDSVASMEQIAKWFCETFQPSIINFETLKPTLASETSGLAPPDPYLFANRCVRAIRLVRGYGVEAVYAAACTEAPRRSFCPVGKDTLIVSPDGRVSSCYLPRIEWVKKGLDLDVGRIQKDGSVRIDNRAIIHLRRLVTQNSKCKRCYCRWTCAGGCHVSHTPPGSSDAYRDFCIQTRIITACKLLDEMGCGDRADGLLASPTTMEKLALQITDCLQEMGNSFE